MRAGRRGGSDDNGPPERRRAARDVVGERLIEVPEGSTVATLSSLLDIRKDYNEVYLVNGRRRARDAPSRMAMS